jgi:pimeloyl-ACP methyl ester carboxylesterase
VPTIDIGGRTVAYDSEGAGPPIVMVNGFAAARADWDPTFVAGLAEAHEVVRLDNRGVGESASDGKPFTVDDLAGDVAEAIGALGLERPAVLGWSMGGFVVQELAATRPELVGGLVLLSTRAAGDSSALSTTEVKERLLDFSGTPREQASRLISLLFLPERAREIDERFGDVVAEARAALAMETVDQQKAILASWGGRERQLADIRCPALVATAADDVVVPPANALALAAGIDGAWLARFPRSGHGFMADHPERLAALIATFLAV